MEKVELFIHPPKENECRVPIRSYFDNNYKKINRSSEFDYKIRTYDYYESNRVYKNKRRNGLLMDSKHFRSSKSKVNHSKDLFIKPCFNQNKNFSNQIKIIKLIKKLTKLSKCIETKIFQQEHKKKVQKQW